MNTITTNPNQTVSDASAQSADQWQARCAELVAENDRLRSENLQLRDVQQALAAMIPVPDEIQGLANLSPAEVMGLAEWDPPFEDMVEQVFVEQQSKPMGQS